MLERAMWTEDIRTIVINTAWPHYKADEGMIKRYGMIGKEAIMESREVFYG
jgi:hypothetical protein